MDLEPIKVVPPSHPNNCISISCRYMFVGCTSSVNTNNQIRRVSVQSSCAIDHCIRARRSRCVRIEPIRTQIYLTRTRCELGVRNEDEWNGTCMTDVVAPNVLTTDVLLYISRRDRTFQDLKHFQRTHVCSLDKVVNEIWSVLLAI